MNIGYYTVAVYNVPENFDSWSFREFFQCEINRNYFQLFHFKNRPEASIREIIHSLYPEIELEMPITTNDSDITYTNGSNGISTITYKFNSSGETERDHSMNISVDSYTNKKSGFLKIESSQCSDFLEKYHGRCWQTSESTDGKCHLALLSKNDDERLLKFEEFYPPHNLQFGNVGTPNQHYIHMLRLGVPNVKLSNSILQRAATMFNWALPHEIHCSNSEHITTEKPCDFLFIFNIPHNYKKSHLKMFFQESIDVGEICDLIYIERPTTNLLQFAMDNHIIDSIPQGVTVGSNNSNVFTEESVMGTDNHDLYPFPLRDTNESKSCLLRVKNINCSAFIRKYHRCPWKSKLGSQDSQLCFTLKIKPVDTECLRFLTEQRVFESSFPAQSTGIEEWYLEAFSTELPPAAVADRFQAVFPDKWQQVQARLRTRKISVRVEKPPCNDDEHDDRGYCTMPPPYQFDKPPDTLYGNTQYTSSGGRLRSCQQDTTKVLKMRECMIATADNIERSGDSSLLSHSSSPIISPVEDTLDNSNSENVSSLLQTKSQHYANLEMNETWEEQSKKERRGAKFRKCVRMKTATADDEFNHRNKPRPSSCEKDRKSVPQMSYSSLCSEDGSDVEEWERSEVFRDTIDEKRSGRERLYEEEIEQVWEKGGSGLNFYTDEAYWRAQEGGMDERNIDEWDVDMQGYYGGVPGDYDAQCRQDMDRMDRLRQGGDESCFIKPKRRRTSRSRDQLITNLCSGMLYNSDSNIRDLPVGKFSRARVLHNCNTDSRTQVSHARPATFIAPCRDNPDVARRKMLVNLRQGEEPVPLTKTARRKANKARRGDSKMIGEFECHTQGFGRRVMEAQGWSDGCGLGKGRGGRTDIIRDSGRNPQNKGGLGFQRDVPPWIKSPIEDDGSCRFSVEGRSNEHANILVTSLGPSDGQWGHQNSGAIRRTFKDCLDDYNPIYSRHFDKSSQVLENTNHEAVMYGYHTSFVKERGNSTLLNERESLMKSITETKRKDSILNGHLDLLRGYGSDDENSD